MLLLASRFTNLPVGSIQSGHRVAVVHRLIINPQGLKISALEVTDTANNLLYVHAEDIAEMRPIGILIHHNEQLMESNDLVRLQSLLEKNYELVGKRVATKSGKKLGTVSDYVVLSDSWHVQKIHVQPGIVKMFAQGDLIIDRQQIISVSDSQVTVHDAATQAKVKKTAIDKASLLRKLKTEPATASSAQSSSTTQQN